jgi:hypothetical protein
MSEDTQDTKVCIACGLPKSIKDDFYASRRAGHAIPYSRCKDCHNAHVAKRRREKIDQDPQYLKRESARVATYRSVEGNRKRANARSTANHEAVSRLKARYPGEFATYHANQLKQELKRSVALYRASRELREKHYGEYKAMYREALKRKGVT